MSCRQVARFVGLVISQSLSIRTCHLHLRGLQQDMISTLRSGLSWDQPLKLGVTSRDELLWWALNANSLPRAPIHQVQAEHTIESDASNLGWGARYNYVTTGGSWSNQQLTKYSHINQLELLGAFLALQSFGKEWKKCHVLLKMDNKSAVAYVNKLGGTRSLPLNSLALEIWEWCLRKEIWISAEYLPGREKLWADWESRHCRDLSGWKLRPDLFQALMKFHMNCKVDLFANYQNHQLPKYFSWKPDPMAEGTDVFSISWRNLQAYAFPPFCLIGKVIRKCLTDQAQMLLITPWWTQQHWFPLVL